MLEYVSYILCFGLLISFLTYIYIRTKYGFWVLQPVFHIYDFHYMLNPQGIIQHSLPEKNKYTNFKDIDTIHVSQLTSIQKTRFFNLIKINYLRNQDNLFSPEQQNILPYFIGHNDKSFVSFYYKNENLLDLKRGAVLSDKQIIGAITSRPLNVVINKDHAKFRVYYVDYLVVDTLHRKKGIAPQLIQTHHYNQRHLNKNIVILSNTLMNLPLSLY